MPSDRTIVIERFRDEIGDWRVCVLTPFGGRVHAPWALALSARLHESLGLGGAVDLVGRRHRSPPAGCGRGARRRRAAARSGGRRGARAGGGGGERALRLALPRERRARAAHPAATPGRADAALAAAAEGAVPAPGGAALPRVPDRARDLSRVPAGRLRPPGASAAVDGGCVARAGRRRRGDAVSLALRVFAALRLRGDVHVRGRHAAGGAACTGAVARPRSAARATGPGGAARPAGRGRGRGRRASVAWRPA